MIAFYNSCIRCVLWYGIMLSVMCLPLATPILCTSTRSKGTSAVLKTLPPLSIDTALTCFQALYVWHWHLFYWFQHSDHIIEMCFEKVHTSKRSSRVFEAGPYVQCAMTDLMSVHVMLLHCWSVCTCHCHRACATLVVICRPVKACNGIMFTSVTSVHSLSNLPCSVARFHMKNRASDLLHPR